MPKQSFHINRFEGGLNTDLAPEDIPNNSLLDSLGASVSKIGRIVMSGDPQSDASGASPNIDAVAARVTAGHGLFAFNSDYDKDDEENATNYLALSNGSSIGIFDGSEWVTAFTFDLGANSTVHDTEVSYYAPNGDLRVCDGKFNNQHNFYNNAKWFGYVPNKTIGYGGTVDANIGGWQTQDASIEGGYPKDSSGIATNGFMLNTSSAASRNGIGDINDGTVENGVALDYVASSNSATSTDLAGSTWQKNASIQYRFYASYVYDRVGDTWQEGTPTPLKMYPSLQSYVDKEEAIASTENLRFMETTTNSITAITATSVSSTTLTVTAANTYSAGDTVLIEGTASFDGYYTVLAGGLSTSAFTVTTSASNANETGYVSVVGTNLAVYFTPHVKFNGNASSNFNLGNEIGNSSGGNERITGTRIYWSSSEEGHGNLWIMFDIDFEKGAKAYGIGLTDSTVTDWIDFRQNSTFTTGTGSANIIDWGSAEIGFNVWKHPPRYETFESLNGYSHDSKLDAKWKTAVIVNGRAYIANIKRREKSTWDAVSLTTGKQSWNGSSDDEIKKDPTFGDRILKSPVDRFDTFPEEMAIELFGGDDGDSVVKLEAFADRLLVFKKNTLHILNIAKDVEILESSHKGLGLDGEKPCQSCLTSTGVAWINSNGVYHYNGQSIESLIDNKIESFWKGHKQSYTNSSFTKFFLAINIDAPSIGFDEESNKLIIHRLSTNNTDSSIGTDPDNPEFEDILIYDMKIKAWTWIKDGLINHKRSNMVTYNKGIDGKYLIYQSILSSGSATNSFYKYSDTPSASVASASASEGLNVITKPYDFGSPLTRKKIYKVYVTYRCNDATNVQLQYYVNGNYGSLYNFTTGASNPFNANDDNIGADVSIMELDDTSGLWETASLKPATSSQANNIKSFGLKFFNDNGQTVDADFEINDITIIYRNKSVK